MICINNNVSEWNNWFIPKIESVTEYTKMLVTEPLQIITQIVVKHWYT